MIELFAQLIGLLWMWACLDFQHRANILKSCLWEWDFETQTLISIELHKIISITLLMFLPFRRVGTECWDWCSRRDVFRSTQKGALSANHLNWHSLGRLSFMSLVWNSLTQNFRKCQCWSIMSSSPSLWSEISPRDLLMSLKLLISSWRPSLTPFEIKRLHSHRLHLDLS